jgi:hypothetical protein
MFRKIMLGVCAVGLPIGLLAVVVAPSVASASVTKNGTGNYNCTKITGTISFNPALTLTGTAKTETVTIKASSTGCSGGTPAVTKNTGTEVKKTTGTDENACGTLASPSSADLKITYSNGAAASTVKGSTSTGTAGNGDSEFIISPATVTGSYPSTTGSITAVLSQTESQILAQCNRKAGVKSLKIASGTASTL